MRRGAANCLWKRSRSRLLYWLTPVMRNAGVGLLIAAYVWLLYTSLAAMLAEYAARWPTACALALNGLVFFLIPIRCGEKWAIWLSVVTLLILLATRTATDPRCLVVLDPHQHGCHTFMISTVLGFVGLALAAPGRSKPGQSQTAA